MAMDTLTRVAGFQAARDFEDLEGLIAAVMGDLHGMFKAVERLSEDRDVQAVARTATFCVDNWEELLQDSAKTVAEHAARAIEAQACSSALSGVTPSR